jgi:hypothetical protein
MSTRQSGRNDYGSNNVLSGKLQSLQNINKEIKILKNSLRTFCKRRDELESEIAHIRSSTAPVRRIPVEVLSIIFKEIVQIEYNDASSMSLAIQNRNRLLMVCRDWRDIALNDSQLWNFLMVKPPNTVSIAQHMKWIRQECVYIDTCLSRSKEAPLDILLDLEEIKSGYRYVMDQVSASLDEIIQDDDLEWLDEESEEGLSDGLTAWLDDIPWNECPVEGIYDESLVKLMMAITGKDGSNIKRWRSLHLRMPKDLILEKFWNTLDYPFPRLLSLSLRGFWNKSHLFALSFAFLSAEVIELYDIPTDWIPPCPKLHQLKLVDYYRWNEETIGDLRRFTQLPKLTLIKTIYDEHCVPTDNSMPFPLPSLDHLDVFAPYESNLVKYFECGRIGKLTIDLNLSQLILQAPIQVFTVAESVVVAGSLESYERSPDRVLSDFLAQFSSARTIQVHPSIVHRVLRSIDSLREGGNLRSLRTVIAGDKVTGVCGRVYPIADTAALS